MFQHFDVTLININKLRDAILRNIFLKAHILPVLSKFCNVTKICCNIEKYISNAYFASSKFYNIRL